jgi:hypothetical protein
VSGVYFDRGGTTSASQKKINIMKALALSSVLAVGLLFAGSALADTPVYNSKTSQNVTFAPSTGGSFDGTYLSSKSGSGISGPTQAQAGKTDKRVACSRRSQMSPETCAAHCGLALNQ